MLDILRRLLPRRSPPTIGLAEASETAMAFLEQVGNDDQVQSTGLGWSEQGKRIWRFSRPFRRGGTFILEVDATYGFVSLYAVQRR